MSNVECRRVVSLRSLFLKESVRHRSSRRAEFIISMFISFFSDQTGRSRPEAALRGISPTPRDHSVVPENRAWTPFVMASAGQPVAHTAHPKHRSKFTSGTSLSPMTGPSGGAAFDTGLTCGARIRIKAGLESRVEKQSRFILWLGQTSR
jgi:hypothetical protein